MGKNPVFPAEMENLDMEAVARVAREADLQEIYLLHAQISRELMDGLTGTLSLNYQCSSRILLGSAEKNVLPVACDFTVSASPENSPGEEVMRIEASFCANYTFQDLSKLASEDIQQFARINPLYNVWAYWREFVQSMTTRMGFPALTVPLLRIVPQKPGLKQSKSRTSRKAPASKKKANH